MTPDDKRRLAQIRELQTTEEAGRWYSAGHHTTGFLLRLLDEATEERDDFRAGFETVERQCRDAGRELRACKAELLGYGEAAEYFFGNIGSVTTESDAADAAIDLLKAAHSAATKPTDAVEKAQE